MSLQPGESPYPVYAAVRARGELVRSKLGVHLTGSHPLCQEALRDPRFGVAPISELTRIDFDRHAGGRRRYVQPVDDSFLSLNPPEHTRLRKLVAPWFTPRALRARTELVERTVARELDELARRPRFDAVTDFAVRVAISTITGLLGVRTVDHDRFVWWGMTLAGTLNGVRTMGEVRETRAVLGELEAFFDELIAHRRRHPGDDVVSRLVECEADGRPLERKDLLATAQLLFVAGFETMVNLVANAIVTLLDGNGGNGDGDDGGNGGGGNTVRHRLAADPQLAEDVVEEVLRLDSPVQYVARVAREPVELGGHRLRPGSTVVLLLGAANRDPSVFAEPDRFDPGRPNSREHLAFSAGAHFCLGAGLARLQATTMLRELFRRFPALASAGPVTRRPSRNIRGVIHLPVAVRAPSRSEPAA
ncbi:cytochrome P450 [Streptomyces boncukensis]|nr:cytochrome P450 [Streptomyces boncukensis]